MTGIKHVGLFFSFVLHPRLAMMWNFAYLLVEIVEVRLLWSGLDSFLVDISWCGNMRLHWTD